MGDNFFLPRLADFQPAQSGHDDSPLTPARDLAEPVNGDDEDYTIRCVCDYTDDDGNTVLCERCNTWQHIICYYFPRESLDDDFHHSCVICNPRHVDSHQANTLQHRRRDPVVAEEKKVRKEKAQRYKKAKTNLINGVADHSRTDVRDASPRDGAPPAKRPKTNHRHSASMASTMGAQRNRAMSMVKRRPQLSELPSNYFSSDFFQAQLDQHNFRPSTANLHLNIGITNTLSRWLDDEDEFYKATTGKTHQDVFMHLPQPMEELERPVKKYVETHPEVEFNGQHPMWHKLKATRDITTGEFVGELCGSIGLQEDYVSDPGNKWNKLRHPDHFVFFHPMLPIFIDCRTEGTLLRYARRSCHPSVRISTLITGAREYRFCFTAKHDIAEGDEITVGWDSDPRLSDQSEGRQPMTPSVRDEFSSRAEALLSHFGGCACDVEHCLMLHFDRRIREQAEMPDHSSDAARGLRNGNKKKKSAKKSPTETYHISRASSEAITHGEGDEDMDDARSTSQSTKQSRDNTPSGGVNGSTELTAREKRKLMQSEKLFEQMEAPKRKKRNSGSTSHAAIDALGIKTGVKRTLGSNPNTPVSSKPRNGNSTPYIRENGRPTPDSHSPISVTGQARSTTKSPNGLSRVSPIYRDNSTQTSVPVDGPQSQMRQLKKPYLSLSRRLMRRSLMTFQQVKADANESEPHGDNVATNSSASYVQPLQLDDSHISPNSPQAHDEDLKNKESGLLKTTSGFDVSNSARASEACPPEREHDRSERPPPDKSPDLTAKVSSSDDKENADVFVHQELRVELAPPPTFSKTATTASVAPITTRSSATSTTAQSPPTEERSPTNSAPPLFLSPSLEVLPNTAAISGLARPSPVKKKMSLSDYMNKKKAETPMLARVPSDAAISLDKEVKEEQSPVSK